MLIKFYGEGCPHCEKMEPVVEQLEKETGVTVERKEVWEDADNKDELDRYDNGVFGGVPFFYNTETKASICGEATIEELKVWAGK